MIAVLSSLARVVATLRPVGQRRAYPIKRDRQGRSARSRAFAYFTQGFRPSQIPEDLGVTRGTLYRYHDDWKHGVKRAERQRRFRLLKDLPGLADEIAARTRLKVGEVEEALRSPHPEAALNRAMRKVMIDSLRGRRSKRKSSDLQQMLKWYSGADKEKWQTLISRLSRYGSANAARAEMPDAVRSPEGTP